MSDFSHVDEQGRARMVDVGDKAITARRALATGVVRTREDVVARIFGTAAERLPKGDVLAAARLAGIMAAKRTAELIPLCHPLRLDTVGVELAPQGDAVVIRAEVRAHDRTGVEMEALTAVSVAALTVYDMCKAVDRAMVIERVRLEEKSGGRGGDFVREEAADG